VSDTEPTETVEEFRLRARDWLAANMPKKKAVERATGGSDEGDWLRARELQKILHSGGFAGLHVPKEYGGQGLPVEYQQAFTEESIGYEMPLSLNVPSLSICAPVLLTHGTEEQKREFLPKVISGEIILCQFLSEPSGGSNLAGVLTRADRDGDSWVINGSKIWSTSAYAADYALCLTRSDWDAPKHRGLTMFLVKVHQPGVDLRRITMVNGSDEFCQEFFDDLVIPDSMRVGEVNDGWTIASTQLFYERQAVGGGSPYVSGVGVGIGGGFRPTTTLSEVARHLGVDQEPWAKDLIAKNRIAHTVHHELVGHVGAQVAEKKLPGVALSLIRLAHAEANWAEYDAGLEISGAAGVSHSDEFIDGQWAKNYLSRQGSALGGGSTEMARNIISERVLQMPREAAPDKDIPFREVRQGR